MAGRFTNFTPDANLIDPEGMDELLFSPFGQALGEETRERIQMQYDNYEYYEGKQHRDESGNLVSSDELERPAGLDYTPKRYETNYFKAIIDRKARWQMSGEHTVHAIRENIDSMEDKVEEGYEPSTEQMKENERADALESILRQLWKENKMRSKLIQAARDRLIADRVVCKIVFNQKTGKLKWVWRPDTEYFPVYSDDDFEDLIACHFIRQKIVEKNGEEVEAFQKQTFSMEENGECYLEEAVYDAKSLEPIETIIDKASMGIGFIPVVEVTVDEILGSRLGEGEISHLRKQNDVLNQMNEDAIDSLKFEMFSMTAVINAPEGTAAKMEIAPGAVIEAIGAHEGTSPDVKKIEGGFRWKEAFKDQYARVKAAMHEISGLPQVVPQELNFGGLNGEALRILYQDIIADTEEQWLEWQHGLAELHEKSIKYLQERTSEPEFAYDKDKLRLIEKYDTEIRFQLPLPDNRREKVSLVADEMNNGLESIKGAMKRLGVDNAQAKMKEIENEELREKEREDLYAKMEDFDDEDEEDKDDDITDQTIVEYGGSRGDEPMITCPTCGGSGNIASKKTGETIKCPECGGEGIVQARKR